MTFLAIFTLVALLYVGSAIPRGRRQRFVQAGIEDPAKPSREKASSAS